MGLHAVLERYTPLVEDQLLAIAGTDVFPWDDTGVRIAADPDAYGMIGPDGIVSPVRLTLHEFDVDGFLSHEGVEADGYEAEWAVRDGGKWLRLRLWQGRAQQAEMELRVTDEAMRKFLRARHEAFVVCAKPALIADWDHDEALDRAVMEAGGCDWRDGPFHPVTGAMAAAIIAHAAKAGGAEAAARMAEALAEKDCTAVYYSRWE